MSLFKGQEGADARFMSLCRAAITFQVEILKNKQRIFHVLSTFWHLLILVLGGGRDVGDSTVGHTEHNKRPGRSWVCRGHETYWIGTELYSGKINTLLLLNTNKDHIQLYEIDLNNYLHLHAKKHTKNTLTQS